MWGILTGKDELRKFPLRKFLALHVTVWSFAIAIAAMATGRDLPPNVSNFLTVLAPVVITGYAAGSTVEAIKGKNKEEGE